MLEIKRYISTQEILQNNAMSYKHSEIIKNPRNTAVASPSGAFLRKERLKMRKFFNTFKRRLIAGVEVQYSRQPIMIPI